jgi:hypothetical protein
MPKYRKLPKVVDAEQWSPGKSVPGVAVETADEAMEIHEGRGLFPREPRHYVVTIHGQRAYLDPGDWVITEYDGVHHYPCKPAEFSALYESAG